LGDCRKTVFIGHGMAKNRVIPPSVLAVAGSEDGTFRCQCAAISGIQPLDELEHADFPRARSKQSPILLFRLMAPRWIFGELAPFSVAETRSLETNRG